MLTNSIKPKLRLQLLTTCTFLLSLSDAFAQKPKQGDWLTEVGINMPGGQHNQYFYNSSVSTYFSNNYNYNYMNAVQTVGLNSRYFKKINLVYRTRLSFGGGSNEFSIWNYNGVDGIPFRQSNKSASLSFGFEKHLNNSSNKFSPFHMLGFSAGFNSQKGKHLSDTILGYNWFNSSWNGTGSYLAKMNSLNLGINYLIGFDYWITSDMYLGLEYGIYANFQYSGKQEETLMKVTNFKLSTETVEVHRPFKSFNIGNFATPFIRFGWRFYKSPRSGG